MHRHGPDHEFQPPCLGQPGTDREIVYHQQLLAVLQPEEKIHQPVDVALTLQLNRNRDQAQRIRLGTIEEPMKEP